MLIITCKDVLRNCGRNHFPSSGGNSRSLVQSIEDRAFGILALSSSNRDLGFFLCWSAGGNSCSLAQSMTYRASACLAAGSFSRDLGLFLCVGGGSCCHVSSRMMNE